MRLTSTDRSDGCPAESSQVNTTARPREGLSEELHGMDGGPERMKRVDEGLGREMNPESAEVKWRTIRRTSLSSRSSLVYSHLSPASPSFSVLLHSSPPAFSPRPWPSTLHCSFPLSSFLPLSHGSRSSKAHHRFVFPFVSGPLLTSSAHHVLVPVRLLLLRASGGQQRAGERRE